MPAEQNDHLPDRKEPFSSFVKKMDRLFSDRPPKGMLQSLDNFFGNSRERTFPIEYHETESGYIIHATLPGIPRNQIAVDILPQSVRITAVQKAEAHARGQKFNQSEQAAARLSRMINFAEPIDDKKVKASHRDGILTLHIPKIKGNRIEING